ncbi:DUF3558 domain-containing protein [Nocardia sp. NPDC003482]
MAGRWVVSGLVVGALVLVGGCQDDSSGQGTPTNGTSSAATTTDRAASLWDPCTLPESALTGTGLDPATKESGVLGNQFPGSKTCGWRSDAKWYDLTIYSTDKSLQDIRNRTDFEGLTPTKVGSLDAVQFSWKDDPDRLYCFLAVGLRQGSVTYEAQTRYSVGKQGDPCVEVRHHAENLVKYLPGS